MLHNSESGQSEAWETLKNHICHSERSEEYRRFQEASEQLSFRAKREIWKSSSDEIPHCVRNDKQEVPLCAGFRGVPARHIDPTRSTTK